MINNIEKALSIIDASIDKDDSVELIDSKVNYLNPKHFSVSQLVYALNQ